MDRKKDSSNSFKTLKSASNDNHHLGFDLSGFRSNAEILFFDSRGVLIGEDKVPYSIIATPTFKPFYIPDKYAQSWNKVEVVYLRDPFEKEGVDDLDYYQIPNWIYELPQLKYLGIDKYRIDEHFFSMNLLVRQLVINSLFVDDKELLVQHIGELRNLELLVHNYIFNTEEIEEIKIKNPDIIVLNVVQYQDMLDNGAIAHPW